MLETLQAVIGEQEAYVLVSQQLVHFEGRYVKLYLAIFHHISLACSVGNTKVWTVIYPLAKYEKAAQVTIDV